MYQKNFKKKYSQDKDNLKNRMKLFLNKKLKNSNFFVIITNIKKDKKYIFLQ